jgi:hypothetical protein
LCGARANTICCQQDDIALHYNTCVSSQDGD